ncbi:MAG: hypothetical protein NTX45_07155 [Proteobacteria bacterium]|nr:hypothetical protein [Pseudomonadota bacterium]
MPATDRPYLNRGHGPPYSSNSHHGSIAVIPAVHAGTTVFLTSAEESC